MATNRLAPRTSRGIEDLKDFRIDFILLKKDNTVYCLKMLVVNTLKFITLCMQTNEKNEVLSLC